MPHQNLFGWLTGKYDSKNAGNGQCLPHSPSRFERKELFKTKNLNDPTINISPLSNFQQCDREKLFSIPESDFYPGYFSRDILIFEELLRNEQVKEAINERPEKYRLLIETKAEIKNH